MTSIEIIGAPLDFGANIRGASLGPGALRLANLYSALEALGWDMIERGDLPVPIKETLSQTQQEKKYLPIVAEVCRQLAVKTYQAKQAGAIPLVLGGDHSVAIGSISGISHYYQEKGQALGVIWFDAHADMNTPAISPTGNIHGMPAAALLGHGYPELTQIYSPRPKLQAQHLVFIGLREVDAVEKAFCREMGVTCFTTRDIERRGMEAIIEEAIAIAGAGTAGIHVSFDLDCMDPVEMPGVSTRCNGGIRAREAHIALERIFATKKLSSFDLVELNPCQDVNQQSGRLAVELAQTLFGYQIL